ncbi:MAG: tetratricopeptide repeat protein, partial [Deltaproteobacteria bacterium]
MPPSRPSIPRSGPLETSAEDFLYHLYRGSELLADGRYDGAREELDRALRAQPRDLAAQDLLAKVYFKLGVYPRAIELYQDIVRQFPERTAPRINLALAFLK